MDLTLPSGTPATISRADDPARGLVVIPDIWGLRPLFADMCDSLRDRTGWTVASFEPFPGQELPGAADPDALGARGAALFALVDDDVLRDAVEAAEATGCAQVGLIGFCMGGMYALKASATGRFDRIASFYGMIHVPEHWSGPGHGDPVDALSRRGTVDVVSVIGTADGLTPPDHVLELEAAGVTVYRYEGAEHGFVHDATRPAHRPADAADAWDKVLTFLGG
jgi:dienelactone hydrolase